MALKKILMKNTTSLSINERFTLLRRNPEQASAQRVREAATFQQQASVKNRRLAQQMERRPAVMAALKIKKRNLRHRLGQPFEVAASSVKDRLSFTVPNQRATFRGSRVRGIGRGRIREAIRGAVRGAGLNRSSNFVPLNRNNVVLIENTFRSVVRGRGRGRVLQSNTRTPFRSPRGALRGRATVVVRGRGIRRSRVGTAAVQRVGAGRGQVVAQFRPPVRGSFRGQLRGQLRGRGQVRGQLRGRGGSRGRRGSQQVSLSKDELDKQIDQYMSSTKSSLDHEMDVFKSESWA